MSETSNFCIHTISSLVERLNTVLVYTNATLHITQTVMSINITYIDYQLHSLVAGCLH